MNRAQRDVKKLFRVHFNHNVQILRFHATNEKPSDSVLTRCQHVRKASNLAVKNKYPSKVVKRKEVISRSHRKAVEDILLCCGMFAWNDGKVTRVIGEGKLRKRRFHKVWFIKTAC